MARVRLVEIENFRGIKRLRWSPSPGINGLIGPGDSGKSSILDAIDFCVGARRSLQISDADFFNLDVDAPIRISVTVGNLDGALMNIDAYGMYLRGFDAATSEVLDEPEAGAEPVLTLQLEVGADLEPNWCLVSERADAQNHSRNLSWSDRVRLSPTRIGTFGGNHLSWRRGSVLNVLSEHQADAAGVLVQAARDARRAFGMGAEQFADVLHGVSETARELGVDVGGSATAMLNVQSASFGGATIALHDAGGVPLYGLGTGSSRLLAAGLQRKAAATKPIVLIDELEHGLEPHRIIRLLHALGAKEDAPPLQVFLTTHSPVAVQELSESQLFIVRSHAAHHELRSAASGAELQGTMRSFPSAFLAASVLVCEGATEIGLIRGLDQYRSARGKTPAAASGLALVDGRGKSMFKTACDFRSLGYRTAVLRDDDERPTPELEESFKKTGGSLFSWRAGRATEQELFLSLTERAVQALIGLAIEFKGEEIVDANIKSKSNGQVSLHDCQQEISLGNRQLLGLAAKSSSWFKSVSAMERAARDVVGPDLDGADPQFHAEVERIFAWIENKDFGQIAVPDALEQGSGVLAEALENAGT